jgi:hypothetical protein
MGGVPRAYEFNTLEVVTRTTFFSLADPPRPALAASAPARLALGTPELHSVGAVAQVMFKVTVSSLYPMDRTFPLRDPRSCRYRLTAGRGR